MLWTRVWIMVWPWVGARPLGYGSGYGLRFICRARLRCRALVLEPYQTPT